MPYLWKGVIDTKKKIFEATQIDITESAYILNGVPIIFDEQDPKNPIKPNLFTEKELNRTFITRCYLIRYSYSFFEIRKWFKEEKDLMIESLEDQIDYLKEQKIKIEKLDKYFYDNDIDSEY